MVDRTTIYGLVVQCPFGEECKNCPLHELRQVEDFAERVEIIDSMSCEEINEITQFHKERRLERDKGFFQEFTKKRLIL